jgi:SSS family solute:Na+ symporter
MTTEFGFIDYLVFTAYAVLILGVGLWVSREKTVIKKMRKIIFSKSLPGGPLVLH